MIKHENSERSELSNRRQAGLDLDLGFQGPVDRAHVGDFEQPRALDVAQVAGERDLAGDVVDPALARLAIGTVGGVVGISNAGGGIEVITLDGDLVVVLISAGPADDTGGANLGHTS